VRSRPATHPMLAQPMALSDDLRRIADVGVAYAAPDEELSAVIPTEAADGERVYLCAFTAGERKSWLALDAGGAPVHDRRVLRDAVSIAAICELAEETAGGGHLDELRAQLAALRETEAPGGIDEAERAVAELELVVGDELRVASPGYLDEIGAATRRLERALDEQGGSPFSEAMKQAGLTIDGLAADIESHYKLELD
jgi:hypothetical protein